MTDSNAVSLPSPPAPAVWPSVGFTDVEAGVRLMTEALGFVVTAMYRGGDGTVEHAEARWPDGGGVMFGSRGKAGAWGALGPQGVYVVAAEAATVDKAWERTKNFAGVEVLNELTDTDYGSHQFGFRDADGNLWSMGTYRGA
ncbi:MAG TPA: VOC family protein [Micromonosporaceae bacterium]|nr:VOC family protein [Micromonosporaceae bacterium]